MRLIVDLVTVAVVGFTTVVAAGLVATGLRPRTLKVLLAVVATTAAAGLVQWVGPPVQAAERAGPPPGDPVPTTAQVSVLPMTMPPPTATPAIPPGGTPSPGRAGRSNGAGPLPSGAAAEDARGGPATSGQIQTPTQSPTRGVTR